MRKFITEIGVDSLGGRLVNSKASKVSFQKPEMNLEKLIMYGMMVVEEQDNVKRVQLADGKRHGLGQGARGGSVHEWRLVLRAGALPVGRGAHSPAPASLRPLTVRAPVPRLLLQPTCPALPWLAPAAPACPRATAHSKQLCGARVEAAPGGAAADPANGLLAYTFWGVRELPWHVAPRHRRRLAACASPAGGGRSSRG